MNDEAVPFARSLVRWSKRSAIVPCCACAATLRLPQQQPSNLPPPPSSFSSSSSSSSVKEKASCEPTVRSRSSFSLSLACSYHSPPPPPPLFLYFSQLVFSSSSFQNILTTIVSILFSLCKQIRNCRLLFFSLDNIDNNKTISAVIISEVAFAIANRP